MSKHNRVLKTFYLDGTWTAPAGLTNVRVRAISPYIYQCNFTALNAMLAIDSNRDAYAWGDNSNAQLGDNTTTTRSSPVLVVGSKKWKQIVGGVFTSGGIDTSNNAYCWGVGTTGAMGDNAATSRSSPVLVAGGFKWKQISSSTCNTNTRPHFLGITTSGDLYAWGSNNGGALGDNSTTNRSSPVLVAGGKKWIWCAAGDESSAAVDINGDAYTWGNDIDSQGVLGNNTAGQSRSSPVAIVGGYKFIQIVGGQTYAGLTSAGEVYCWGRGNLGQCGDNAASNRSSPVLVVGGKKFVKLTPGNNTGHRAIDVNGDLYSWGSLDQGALGDNTTQNRSSPVLVVGAHKWSQASGVYSGFGITINGIAYGWGEFPGDNTATAQSSPVLVVGGKTFNALHSQVIADLLIPVIPGTTYNIVTKSASMSFGSTILGQIQGPADHVVLEY